MTSHSERLTFAKDLAERAGKLGMEFFRKLDQLTIESKGHQDMVSEADREVELFVRAEIAKAYPEDGIVGEEHAPTKGSTGYTWVIDPIDGTANFVKRHSRLVRGDRLRQGRRDGNRRDPRAVDRRDFLRRRRAAARSSTASRSRRAPSKSLGDGSLGVGFSNRRETANVPGLISDLLDRGGIFYRNASGALMLAYVASGRLIGYVEEHMNAWDCIAGMLLVEEAGGRIVRPDPKTVLEKGTLV